MKPKHLPAIFLTLWLLCLTTNSNAAATEPAQITAEKIAALPEKERTVWQAYWDRSQRQSKLDHESIDAELKAIGQKSAPFAPRAKDFKLDAAKPAAWYSGAAAKDLGEIIISYQTHTGGWVKHVGYEHRRKKGERYSAGEGWSYVATFDNGATITELRFLAKMYQGTGEEIYRDSILRGLEYVFMAQFPNGGWPQVYPLSGGYHDAITYNDNAMINILRLLRDVVNKQEGFAFVPADIRQRAGTSLEQGMKCILKSQVVVNGKRTAWGQQYDALTLKPTSARAYEMISISGGESADIMRFLMGLESPTAAEQDAVHAAAAWFRETTIQGQEWKDIGTGRQLVPKEGAGPLWARYYEIGTNKPLFGDRDHSIHYDVTEISKERRNGYAWYTNAGQYALKEYEKWSEKHPLTK